MILLDGSAADRIVAALNAAGVPYAGPHDALEPAVREALVRARGILEADGGTSPGEVVVLLSPGYASFGMFTNEFDRGRQFCAVSRALLTELGLCDAPCGA